MNILVQKTAKTVNFIKWSLFAVSQLIYSWAWNGIIIFLVIPTVWPIWLLVRTVATHVAESYVTCTKKTYASNFFFLGLGVLTLPLLPFFVYHNVPITNYVFVIPSLGMSFLLAAFMSAKPRSAAAIFLPIYFTAASVFLGYPSSLSNFLNYWYGLSEHVDVTIFGTSARSN